jgi:hypothetical protein
MSRRLRDEEEDDASPEVVIKRGWLWKRGSRTNSVNTGGWILDRRCTKALRQGRSYEATLASL